VAVGFTRRALLVGSAGAALAGCTGSKPERRRTITGVRIGRQAGAVDVAYLRDGAHAIAADTTTEGTINVWDLRSREITRSFRVGRRLSYFALDEGRGLLAAASRNGAGEYAIGLFDFATGRHVRQIGDGHPLYGVDGLFVAQEGLLTCYADRAVREESTLWSFETGRQLAHFGRPAEAIAADKRTVLGGHVIWDLTSGRVRGELKRGSRIWGHALSGDGNRAVSETGRSGILWNDRGEVVQSLGDQSSAIARAAFSPDGRFLITGRYAETFRGNGRLLVLRDGHTGRLLAELPGHEKVVRGIAFSPDGSSALSAGLHGELILWKIPRDAR
jgi:WD40 repeat protein